MRSSERHNEEQRKSKRERYAKPKSNGVRKTVTHGVFSETRTGPLMTVTAWHDSKGGIVARLLLEKSAQPRGRNMKMPLIVAISLICAAPLYAQDQQPNTVKLKADAQRVVSIIQSDKVKTQVYCEINDLGEQIGEADQRMDDNKAEALSRQVTELEKRLGPEYFALANDLNNVDPNSPEGRDIESIFAPLDGSCD